MLYGIGHRHLHGYADFDCAPAWIDTADNSMSGCYSHLGIRHDEHGWRDVELVWRRDVRIVRLSVDESRLLFEFLQRHGAVDLARFSGHANSGQRGGRHTAPGFVPDYAGLEQWASA